MNQTQTIAQVLSIVKLKSISTLFLGVGGWGVWLGWDGNYVQDEKNLYCDKVCRM